MSARRIRTPRFCQQWFLTIETTATSCFKLKRYESPSLIEMNFTTHCEYTMISG